MSKLYGDILIHVNGEIKDVDSQCVSYEQVMALAGVSTPEKHDYVLFIDALSDPNRGILTEGEDVIVSLSFPTQFQVV